MQEASRSIDWVLSLPNMPRLATASQPKPIRTLVRVVPLALVSETD